MPLSIVSSGNVGGITLLNRGSGGTFSANVTIVADSIRTFLTGSSSASYDAASINTWIKVSKAEYDNVAANVASVTKVGGTDADINNRLVATGYTLSQTSDFSITAGSYIFGMILEPWNTNSSGSVGYTTAVTGSISTYSSYFGDNFVGLIGGTRNYFILKKPTGATSQTVYPFVTMSSSPNGMNYKSWGWTGVTWQFLPASSNAMGKFQLLTTTVKQW
jgi:hypothetical protein